MYIGTNVFLSILSYFDLFFFFFYRVSSGISSDWRTCRQRDPSKMGVLPRRFYLQTSASLGEHSPFFQTLLKLRISTETCSNRNLSILYIVLSLETYFFWSPALYTSPPPPISICTQILRVSIQQACFYEISSTQSIVFIRLIVIFCHFK